MIDPVTTVAHLAYDKATAPEFITPALMVDVLTDTVALRLSRQQYLNVLDLAEGLQLMEVNQRYRKYRPQVPRRGHAKEW